MTSNIVRYSPSFIKELSESITSILDVDIINNLLEIKNNNKFIRRKSPIKLRYVIDKSVSNKWRKEKLENDDREDMDIYLENLNKNLNKMTESNFNNVKDNVLELINSSEHKDTYMEVTLNTIFNKCLLEYLYANLYANLLKILVDIYDDNVFIELILKKTNSFYNDNICKTFNVENNLNYDELCTLNKEKSKLLGSFILIGCLYKNDIIDYDLVMKYCNLLFENSLYSDDKPETLEKYVECLCTLMENIQTKLKNKLGDIFQKEIIGKLEMIQKDKSRFKSRIRFKVMDLIELCKKNI